MVNKTLPHCKVIFSQPGLRLDNGKTPLTLHHLNGHFSQLNLDAIDNSDIKVKRAGLKGLRLYPKG